MTRRIRIANHSLKVPGNPRTRRWAGVALIIGGILGFLPVLGFWMVPLGLIMLSIDSSTVRRWRRQMEVKCGPWLKERFPRIAGSLGFSINGNSKKRS